MSAKEGYSPVPDTALAQTSAVTFIVDEDGLGGSCAVYPNLSSYVADSDSNAFALLPAGTTYCAVTG
jgi:hypothetical protein